MDEAVLTWEIDRLGDLLATKEDESGSSMLRLGPVEHVIASLADFLKRAETAGANASVDTHAQRGDSTQIEAPSLMGSAVGEAETPTRSRQSNKPGREM